MIYFASLKTDLLYSKIKKTLSEKDLEVLKYYPRFKILKIESEKKLDIKDFPEFETLEEEKSDFSV